MWKATRGGHELKHLGLLSALRSANLYVRAKLNRGAVSLGTDASRRAKELRSRVRRSNAVVEAGDDTFGSVTGDHTGSHGVLFYFKSVQHQHHLVFFYLFPTALVAMIYGSVLSMVCATFAILVAAFFLYDPIYSLYVSDPRDIGELILFAVTGLIAAKCTAELMRSPEKRL